MSNTNLCLYNRLLLCVVSGFLTCCCGRSRGRGGGDGSGGTNSASLNFFVLASHQNDDDRGVSWQEEFHTFANTRVPENTREFAVRDSVVTTSLKSA